LSKPAARVSLPPDRLWWTSFDTPIGRLHAFASAAGLCRVTFRDSDEHACERVGLEASQRIERNDAGLHEVREDLLALLDGRIADIRMPLDLGTLRDFQRRVLAETQRIPRGSVVTYGAMAQRVGLPGAAQAVGQALGHNPVPLVIPCHRVIAANGDIGGFTGGLKIKILLLQREGVALPETQPRLDL
jgi:methylated-DNA-[protein]-cysteine S-methyltransferase